MERLKQMKESLISQVQGQMVDLSRVSTHELGEVIDMIKDLEEAMYYCTVVEAMEGKTPEEQKYYTTRYLPPYYGDDYYRDIDRTSGRMYYTGGSSNNSNNRSGGQESSQNYGSRDMRGYEEWPQMLDMRDRREGRSPISRKTYVESKEMHQDKATQMRELEKYMTELSQDLTEIIQMASPEEKAVLQKKLTGLSSKIM